MYSKLVLFGFLAYLVVGCHSGFTVTPSKIARYLQNIYSLPTFKWSFAGPLSGYNCIQIHEFANSGWDDNYLCSQSISFGDWKWSSAGRPAGYTNCMHWYEPSTPSWDDNWLCSPPSHMVNYNYFFTNNGAGARAICIAVPEPSTSGWTDNYFCVQSAKEVPYTGTGARSSSVVQNGRIYTFYDFNNQLYYYTKAGTQLLDVSESRVVPNARTAGLVSAVAHQGVIYVYWQHVAPCIVAMRRLTGTTFGQMEYYIDFCGSFTALLHSSNVVLFGTGPTALFRLAYTSGNFLPGSNTFNANSYTHSATVTAPGYIDCVTLETSSTSVVTIRYITYQNGQWTVKGNALTTNVAAGISSVLLAYKPSSTIVAYEISNNLCFRIFPYGFSAGQAQAVCTTFAPSSAPHMNFYQDPNPDPDRHYIRFVVSGVASEGGLVCDFAKRCSVGAHQYMSPTVFTGTFLSYTTDPQFSRCENWKYDCHAATVVEDKGRIGNDAGDDVDVFSRASVLSQYTAVAGLDGYLQQFFGTRMKASDVVGDMVEHGKHWQRSAFAAYSQLLVQPCYVGMGNHDYMVPHDGPFLVDYSATMVYWTDQRIASYAAVTQPVQYDATASSRSNTYLNIYGSMSYYRDEGNFRVVHVHEGLGHVPDPIQYYYSDHYQEQVFARFTDPLEWLKQIIGDAANRQMSVIINSHERYATYATARYLDQMNQTIKAVFVGHEHYSWGRNVFTYKDAPEGYQCVVPVYFVGSQMYETSLLVYLDHDAAQVDIVGVMNDRSGATSIPDQTSSPELIYVRGDQTKTYPARNMLFGRLI